MMDKKLQQYYDDRFEMMSLQGWKDLLSDVKEMYAATNDLAGTSDEQSLHYKRGELSIMRWILGIEELSRSTYKELTENNDANV